LKGPFSRMSYPLDDTIAAVSSPPGGAARGIVRLSGPKVLACLEDIFRPSPEHKRGFPPTATAIVAGTLQISGINSPIPSDVYVWPDRRSYTGQPAAEIHTLGCQPLLQRIVGELSAAGARPAQPGEFTLRAFLAGRLDLTQAEAVLGVIDAADPAQLDVALAQLAGGLATPLNGLRDALLELLAHLEAGFDFADEDLSFIDREQLDAQLADAAQVVDRVARQMGTRSESTMLSRVVLVGRPNTGKSSLFNALATRAQALVSRQAGTTRDYVTAELTTA
jgi:tRNA modification GTPase